jgi:hypothetical protein
MRAHEAHVVLVALDDLTAFGNGAFNLQPSRVVDLVQHSADGGEVDSALAEQRAVFLGVKLTNPRAAELPYLGDDVVPICVELARS